MSVKELFAVLLTLLFRNRKLWAELKESIPGKEFNVLREYAVPVIALVQLAKFPLIGTPRPAMFFAVTSFLVDVAALYLVGGGVLYLLARERSESFKAVILMVICYSMTPVWLGELFYFTGIWSCVFAILAMVHTIVTSRNGLVLVLDLEKAVFRSALRNIALVIAVITSLVFLLMTAAMRLFNI